MTVSGNAPVAATAGQVEAACGGGKSWVPVACLTPRHVLCLAGEATPAPEEAAVLDALRTQQGDGLYAEALRVLVGRCAVPQFAEQEWMALLAHRSDLEARLSRPVALQTAALDLFCEARPHTPEMALMPADQLQALQREARVDTTTGLFTPSSFAWALEHEVSRARRYRRHIVLLLIDVDDMRALLSRRGQEFGDFVLREVAELVNQNIRNTDTPARIDIDTFAVLLHECRLVDGRQMAERLRLAVETQSFSPQEGDEGAHVTACIAVVGYPESGDGGDRLMKRARALLERAKSSGKNRVEVAEFPA